MGSDHVTLTVPARGEFAKTVRVVAAELATRLQMSYDEVDDVRIAAEEAFVYACGCVGEAAAVTFMFEVGGDTLCATVGPLDACCSPQPMHAAGENYAEFILRSVCDEFSIRHEAGQCVMRFARTAGATSGAAGA